MQITNGIEVDIETRASKSVVKHGLYAHAPTAKILLMWYRIDGGPWVEWRGYFADDLDPDLSDEPPQDFIDALKAGKMIYAWNAAYERVVLSAQPWCPTIPPEQTVCLAAWAASFNLPRALAACSRMLLPASNAKAVDLSKVVSYMWDEGHALDIPEHMKIQSDYCLRDCQAQADIAALLPNIPEWFLHQYWASEHINDRGVVLDMDLARAISGLRPEIDADLQRAMAKITPDVKLRGPSLLNWLKQRLPEDLHHTLMLTEKKREGYGFKSHKRMSSGKSNRETLRSAIDDLVGYDDVRRLLDLYEEGNKAAMAKFDAGLARVQDEMLCGQFVFNGAGQTGRYSSHGVQVHNLKRDVHPDAERIIHSIKTEGSVAGMTITDAATAVLRPMFIADHDTNLLWCDWSSIEARMLPWLSGDERAEDVLDAFRRGEDIYVNEARKILNKEDISPDERQAYGKVPVLSLGYQGGVGAFQSMARNYGVEMPDSEANTIKTNWRLANPWAVDFWHGLERAAFNALNNPNTLHPIGRVTYTFIPDLLAGTLLCMLPSGRFLAYPQAAVRMVQKFEDSPEEPAITFTHPQYGPSSTYGGSLCENITQAESATLLREALVRCEEVGLNTVMHVHDEIVIETDNPERDGPKLHYIMCRVPEWAQGLPLDADYGFGTRYKVANAA